ncbi:hypothetical protein NPIL_90191 [Nephila pilipes]|uniref:Uncharacterized protein n=1 Tax=Nephila pilipes TaxID=299642 RepID=A0A8X6PS16_NEPPI|nr:hypothetical protein NPIL_90191 [Nephila pilipes]
MYQICRSVFTMGGGKSNINSFLSSNYVLLSTVSNEPRLVRLRLSFAGACPFLVFHFTLAGGLPTGIRLTKAVTRRTHFALPSLPPRSGRESASSTHTGENASLGRLALADPIPSLPVHAVSRKEGGVSIIYCFSSGFRLEHQQYLFGVFQVAKSNSCLLQLYRSAPKEGLEMELLLPQYALLPYNILYTE